MITKNEKRDAVFILMYDHVQDYNITLGGNIF